MHGASAFVKGRREGYCRAHGCSISDQQSGDAIVLTTVGHPSRYHNHYRAFIGCRAPLLTPAAALGGDDEQILEDG